jgi:hypothetical protein
MPCGNRIEATHHALKQEGGTAVSAVKDASAAVQFGGASVKVSQSEHGRDARAPIFFAEFSVGRIFAHS